MPGQGASDGIVSLLARGCAAHCRVRPGLASDGQICRAETARTARPRPRIQSITTGRPFGLRSRLPRRRADCATNGSACSGRPRRRNGCSSRCATATVSGCVSGRAEIHSTSSTPPSARDGPRPPSARSIAPINLAITADQRPRAAWPDRRLDVAARDARTAAAAIARDYAIAKLVACAAPALRPTICRIVVLHDTIHGEDHAVAAARGWMARWLMLDNRRMAMVRRFRRQKLPDDIRDRSAAA